MENSTIKTWVEKPTKKEVENHIKLFFDLLKKGQLNEAKEIIGHKSKDWEYQIYSLWQDTYLIFLEEIEEEVEDDSFEGNLWKDDLTWLKKLKIEKKYHWEDDDSLFVNVIYENEVTDVSAEFSIIKGKKGYFVERSIIHIA